MSSKTAASLLPLEVDALCYRVEREDLLKDISVTVDSAGITGILGPNGAGKSLFLRLLHGLLEPVSGEIRWHHQRLDKTIRRRQALVFQKPVLMRRSVAANIDFVLNPGTRSRQRRDEVLQHAGLYRQRSQPARLLSGGEQQRLALARALATEPEVLLLDEPCASLDSATTLQIENLRFTYPDGHKALQETSARGVKIILVTHDIGQARRLADDVIFMHGGRLLEYQTANRFFDSPSSSQARAYLDGKIVI